MGSEQAKHEPDLKQALHKVAPKAEASNPPAALPRQVLDDMLKVDEAHREGE
jgi:hypothetical protein